MSQQKEVKVLSASKVFVMGDTGLRFDIGAWLLKAFGDYTQFEEKFR